ncbi:hypothetical protein CU098_000389, partial [Rhizopus stolonifer]
PRGQIFGTKELNELMNDQKKLIKTKLHEATDIMVFLSELKETLESTHTLKVNAFQPVSTRLSHIYQEISMVGFDKVQSMNETMDEIIFNTRDEKGRDHALKVTLPINYPFVVPQIVAHLPVSIEISPSIATLVRQHEQIVHRYQNVFNCLDELDQHMKVVDPENPKRDEMWRKIALGHHCSLHLEIVNPLLPFDKPQIMLFGGEKRVGDLRKAWERAAWNKEISLYANLMNIFQLVSNESAEKEDYTNTTDIECGICYSYKLENGEAPETILATVQPNNNTEFQHIIR